MFYGVIRYKKIVSIPTSFKIGGAEWPINTRVAVSGNAIQFLNRANDDEESFVDKVDKLMRIIEDVERDGFDATMIKEQLQWYCDDHKGSI